MDARAKRRNGVHSACEFFFFLIVIPAVIAWYAFRTSDSGAYLLAVDYSTQTPHHFLLSMNADDFIRQLPAQDIQYQLDFALKFVREGSIAQWVLNLWPPGMPVLYGMLIVLPGAYFPLKIVALAITLYAAVSYLLYRTLSKGRFSAMALLAVVAPLAYGSFQDSLFCDLGLFSSDFYCFVLLAALLWLVFEMLDGRPRPLRRRLVLAVASGVVLALLAYFRSFYFVYIKFLAATSLIALLGWAAAILLREGWRPALRGLLGNKIAGAVAVALSVAWLCVLPWKLVVQANGSPFEWTATDQVWAAQWRTDLPKFLVGMNTPCVLDPVLCQSLMPFHVPDTWADPKLGSFFYKRLSLATFVSDPVAWYQEKAKVFHYFWFDGYKPGARLDGVKQKRSLKKMLPFAVSTVLLVGCVVLVLTSCARLLRNFARREPLLQSNCLYALFLTFFVFNVILFTFVHYEPRYSIPLKWTTYLILVFLLKDAIPSINLRLRRNSASKGAI